MNWDDVELFLKVAREGSIRSAALASGISHATISRRLKALEQDLGVSLLERQGNRFVRTPAGDDLYHTAAEADDLLSALSLRIAGRDTRLEGIIRVTFPDFFVPILSPDLAEFSQLHPGIELQVLSGQRALNLNQRAADVAIRIVNEPPETLVGRRLGNLVYSTYATPAYLREAGQRPLQDYRWVGWEDIPPHFEPAEWINEHVARRHIVARANTPEAVLELVATGIGVGHVALFHGEQDPRLQRVSGAPTGITGGIWLLTHRDLRQTPRIRKFLDFLGERLARHMPAFNPA